MYVQSTGSGNIIRLLNTEYKIKLLYQHEARIVLKWTNFVKYCVQSKTNYHNLSTFQGSLQDKKCYTNKIVQNKNNKHCKIFC